MSIVFKFPAIPECKVIKNQQTAEQMTLNNYMRYSKFSAEEEVVIRECIDFYDRAFEYLKSLPLTEFTANDISRVWNYLTKIFSVGFLIHNECTLSTFYRVTVIKKEFLYNNKVRDAKYLYNRSLLINKESGVFNRCNSPNTTVMYASILKNVAIRETKPKKGEKILLTKWKNIDGSRSPCRPISHGLIKGNVINDRTTNDLEETLENHHPLMREYHNTILGFIAFEMVKDTEVKSEKKYEYVFSAFFSELNLSENDSDDPRPAPELLIYPSIAYQHLQDNVCIHERGLHKFKPVLIQEFEVIETLYETALLPEDLPAGLKFIRKSTQIKNDLILWDDE